MRLSRRIVDGFRSPARMFAFIRRAGEAARRGEVASLLHRLNPRSFSAEDYRAWRAAQVPYAAATPVPFVVALDVGDSDHAADLATALAESATGASAVLTRANGGWRRLGGADVRPIEQWARDEEGHPCWIWWVAAPLRLEPDAARVFAEACRRPEARLVYADHDVEDEAGRPAWPVFKSAWDCEQVLETPYAGPLLVVHSTLSGKIDRAGDGGGQWGMLIEAASNLRPESVVHVPRVVAHVAADSASTSDRSAERRAVLPRLAAAAERRGEALDVVTERTPWLRYRRASGCRVSIVIPTRDGCELLERCLESLLAHGLGDDDEIVIVDNGSTDPAVATLLQSFATRVSLRVVPLAGPFNFARLCNAGVAAASGRVVVLLNNDTEWTQRDGLAELTALAARSHVGAVGPLLTYPDGIVQSAGVLLGVNRTATSALAGYDPEDRCARAWCATRRRVSAVMGACLAVERDKYLRVGGMDERLAVSHNELDLCLRLEAAGFVNLFTPFVRVVHQEGATRGFDLTAGERRRLKAEEAHFRARWGLALERTDPAHHPALERTGDPFSLAAPSYRARPRAGWRDGVNLDGAVRVGPGE
jgi:GT2 family glycosyltransferase